jgi:hypothetical protein
MMFEPPYLIAAESIWKNDGRAFGFIRHCTLQRMIVRRRSGKDNNRFCVPPFVLPRALHAATAEMD